MVPDNVGGYGACQWRWSCFYRLVSFSFSKASRILGFYTKKGDDRLNRGMIIKIQHDFPFCSRSVLLQDTVWSWACFIGILCDRPTQANVKLKVFRSTTLSFQRFPMNFSEPSKESWGQESRLDSKEGGTTCSSWIITLSLCTDVAYTRSCLAYYSNRVSGNRQRCLWLAAEVQNQI